MGRPGTRGHRARTRIVASLGVMLSVLLGVVSFSSAATASSSPQRVAVTAVGGQIDNLNSSLCLYAGPSVGATAVQTACGGATQQWSVSSAFLVPGYPDAETINIAGYSSPLHPWVPAYCLTAGQGSGSAVTVQSCTFAGNQGWALRTDGTYLNVATGLCMVVANASRTAGAAAIMWACNGTRNSRWATGRGSYQPRALELSPVSSTNGRLLVGSLSNLGPVFITASAPASSTWGIYSINGWPDAYQLAETTSTGSYCLKRYYLRSPLDMVTCPSPPISDVGTWWSRTVNADGTFTFRPYFDSSECIDVYNNNDYDGATVGSWPCNGGDNQKFLSFYS